MTIDINSKLLEAILESSDDAIISKTVGGIITSWSAGATKIFGYIANEMVGKSMLALFPSGHEDEEKDILERIKCGEKLEHFETVRLRKNGTEIDVSVTILPLRDTVGNIVGASNIARDISQRKVADLHRAELLKRLSQSNAELDEFTYIASHDLKAPLRAIDNASKWLEEDLQEHLTGENLENMAMLRGRVHRMERLLDDLLAYSRIGKKNFEDYQEALKGDEMIKNILGLLAIPDGFRVVVSSAFGTIKVMRMPLQQILLNLIGNAIKHHDKERGLVEVLVEDLDKDYLFSVRDDGPGIPARFHDRIFKMSQTLKPKDQVEGSGMGLTMVKKSVDLFGGKVQLVSTEGGGSTFSVIWPKNQQLKREPYEY